MRPFRLNGSPLTFIKQHFCILLVGSGAVGKSCIEEALLQIQHRHSLNHPLKVCKCRRLPDGGDTDYSNCDFLCFIIDLTSFLSFKETRDTMSRVHPSVFIGQALLIVTHADAAYKAGVDTHEIEELAQSYGIPVFYANVSLKEQGNILAYRILCIAQNTPLMTRYISTIAYSAVTSTIMDPV